MEANQSASAHPSRSHSRAPIDPDRGTNTDAEPTATKIQKRRIDVLDRAETSCQPPSKARCMPVAASEDRDRQGSPMAALIASQVAAPNPAHANTGITAANAAASLAQSNQGPPTASARLHTWLTECSSGNQNDEQQGGVQGNRSATAASSSQLPGPMQRYTRFVARAVAELKDSMVCQFSDSREVSVCSHTSATKQTLQLCKLLIICSSLNAKSPSI